jgi:hypothetical protein
LQAWRAGDQLPTGEQYIHVKDMTRKRAIDVVVFAVHIAAYRTAYGNEFGAGRHGQEPSLWHNDFKHLVQGDPALAFKDRTLSYFSVEMVRAPRDASP